MSEKQRQEKVKSVDLDGLAERINAGHEECLAASRTTLEKACAVGRLLLEAKAAVPHGEWTSWVESNCCFAIREGQRYMKLARSIEKLRASGSDVSQMTLTEALDYLSGREKSGEGDAAAEEPIGLSEAAVQAEWQYLQHHPLHMEGNQEQKVQKWIDDRCRRLYAAIRKFDVRSLGTDGVDEARLRLEVLRRFMERVRPEGLCGAATAVNPTTQNVPTDHAATMAAA